MRDSFTSLIRYNTSLRLTIFVFLTFLVTNEVRSEQFPTSVKYTDFKQVGLSDWEVIDKAVSYLSLTKNGRLIIDEDVTVDRAILLPSNFTLELQGDIYQADYSFDNVIRSANIVFDEVEIACVPSLSINTHAYVPISYPTSIERLSNIKIVGNNHKVVASKHVPSAYHPYNEAEEPMIGDDWGSRGMTIAFTNCYDVEISDLEIRDAHCYSVCFDLCNKVYVHDVSIYSPINVNAELDGIDIRTGCSDFLIENIHAETGDDSIAINSGAHPATKYPCRKRYLYPIEGGYRLWRTLSKEAFDISNITVRNVLCKRVDVDGRGVLILSDYGHIISDVILENIEELEGSLRTPDDTVVLIYGGKNYVDNSISNVRINNVKAMEAGKVVTARCKCENVHLNKLYPKLRGVATSLYFPNGFTVENAY